MVTYWSQSKTGVAVKDSAGGDLDLATRYLDSKNVLMYEELKSGIIQAPVLRFLDTVGDGSGTKDAAVDHSGAAEEYMLVPEADEAMRLYSLRVYIRDATTFNSNGYGAISSSPLTNGVQVLVKDGTGTLLDLLHEEPVKCNAHWLRVGDADPGEAFGAGSTILTVTVPLARSGVPIRVNGFDSEYLAVVLNDDFSALTEHYFWVEGFIE
jgi:hypothetical protein